MVMNLMSGVYLFEDLDSGFSFDFMEPRNLDVDMDVANLSDIFRYHLCIQILLDKRIHWLAT